MIQQTNKQFFNDGQMYALDINARDEILVCGRGFGKGAVQARRLQTAVQGMPGSMGGFVAPSVKRCLTNILPSMLIHLERWGFKRDIHYTVGKKPWKALHWKEPLFTPANWENTIAFYNGSVCSIISQDRTGTSNSMSLDYLIIDEAKFIDFERLKDETFQANRGNQMYYGDFFMHHGMTITSDMPITKKGSWFLKYKDDMDTELVSVIEGIVYQIWILRNKIIKYPARTHYYNNQISKLNQQLNLFRSKCLLYKEYTSVENLAILGEDYIKRMKRELPPLTFATSIMCRHIGISADGFYGALRESVNLYTAPNADILNLQNMNDGKLKVIDSRMDDDVDTNLPLFIAFDANSNINWCVVGQIGEDAKLRIVKSFFVKYERKIPELVDDVCKYYLYHKYKKIIFYYDSTFISNNYALHNDDFAHSIVKAFKKWQWQVKDVFIGKQMNHIDKNMLINRMFQGKLKHQILINRDNNPDLLISIQSAGVYDGKKDKRGEKLVETEEDKLESRTDGSDAFDTLCIGVEKFPVYQGSLSLGLTSFFPG